jgi:GT2 family glycosyltransferase
VTPPRHSIVVVCHNRLELTRACLASVMQHSSDFELIVTDNASTDGTADFLRDFEAKHEDRVRVVTNPANAGFKDPCNHALTLARGEFLVLLNNDVEVCEGWLDMLSRPFARNPKLAITGMCNTCTTISPKLVGSRGGRLDYIEGSCLMVPTWLVRKHGLFSDYLRFAYWEDADLSLRLREAGYEIETVPLPMKHDKRGSTTAIVPEAREHLARNTEAMKERYAWYFKRHDIKRRILLRRLGAHGDVLLLTPALRALRNKYPLAEVELVTKCPSMVAGLDTVQLATHSTQWFDQFIDLDLAYEKRSEVHIVRAYADALGVEVPANWKLEMSASDADMGWARQRLRGLRVALVHAGPTCWPGKLWPIERWCDVVAWLQDRGYWVVTVGGEDAWEAGGDDHLGGLTTPQQLYALAKHASLFVGIDSMPQHIASAAECPVVCLFGPTNPRCILRPSPRVVAVQADVAQIPCVGEHGRRKVASTSVPCEGECMRGVEVDMVRSAVVRVERLAL